MVQQGLNLASALRGKLLDQKSFRQFTWAIRIGAGGVFGFSILLTLGAAYQARIQQQLIENGNREQIGLWLRQHPPRPRTPCCSSLWDTSVISHN